MRRNEPESFRLAGHCEERSDVAIHPRRHCEERSDVAIQMISLNPNNPLSKISPPPCRGKEQFGSNDLFWLKAFLMAGLPLLVLPWTLPARAQHSAALHIKIGF